MQKKTKIHSLRAIRTDSRDTPSHVKYLHFPFLSLRVPTARSLIASAAPTFWRPLKHWHAGSVTREKKMDISQLLSALNQLKYEHFGYAVELSFAVRHIFHCLHVTPCYTFLTVHCITQSFGPGFGLSACRDKPRDGRYSVSCDRNRYSITITGLPVTVAANSQRYTEPPAAANASISFRFGTDQLPTSVIESAAYVGLFTSAVGLSLGQQPSNASALFECRRTTP